MSFTTSVVPEKADYMVKLMKNRKARTVRVSPLNKSEFNPSDNCKLRLAGAGYLDLANSYFSYKLTIAQPGTALEQARLTPLTESIIKRMVIVAEATGVELENFDNRDVLSNIFHRHTVGDDVEGSERGVVNGGLGHVVDGNDVKVIDYHNGRGTTTINTAYPEGGAKKQEEIISNHVGFLASQKYIPLHFLGSLLIDIDFNTIGMLDESALYAVNIGEDPVPTPGVETTREDVKFSDFQFVAQIIDFGPEFDSIVAEQVNSPEGLNISYDTYHSSVDSSTTQNITSKMNVSSNSIKSIFTVMRKSTEARAGIRANVRSHGYQFTSSGGLTYQYKINENYYPSFLASVGHQSYAELQHALNRLGDVSSGSQVDKMAVAAANFDALTARAVAQHSKCYMGVTANGGSTVGTLGSFCLGVNCEELNEGSQTQSGLSTKGGNLDIELIYNRSEADAITINSFVHVDRVLNIKAGREVSVLS